MKYLSILALVLLMGCDPRPEDTNYCAANEKFLAACTAFANHIGSPAYNNCCISGYSYQEFLRTKPEYK